MSHTQPHERAGHGFTLVELMIVVSIIAVLAAMVVPKYQNYRAQAAIAATAANVRAIQTQVDNAANESGVWPTDLDPAWFVGGAIPSHPQNTFGVPNHFITPMGSWSKHPLLKVLNSGSSGAYWYNPTNGLVRALVSDQGSAAATIKAYNEINGTNETNLGNYGTGGGGS